MFSMFLLSSETRIVYDEFCISVGTNKLKKGMNPYWRKS